MADDLRDLPAAASRRHIHTRRVTSQGFLRDDGLWDIDGELSQEAARCREAREQYRRRP